MKKLESFKNYLFSQKQIPSKLTVKNYLADIRKFISWIENKFKHEFIPYQINPQVLDEYKTFLLQNFSASSIERQFSALRKFFQFLTESKEININPFNQINISRQQSDDIWHLKSFKNYLYFNNSSSLTIKNYIIDIKQFMLWADSFLVESRENIFEYLDEKLIEEYKKTLLSEKNFSLSSISRKLSSLRKYSAWAKSQGFLVKTLSQAESNLSSFNDKDVLPFEKIISDGNIEISEKKNFAQKAEIKYSRFPPLRLLQKLNLTYFWLSEHLIIIPLARVTGIIPRFFWSAKGKPIFSETKLAFIKKQPSLPGKSSHVPLGFSSLAQELVSEKSFFKKIFKRPEWFKRYQKTSMALYFNLVILFILSTIIGVASYNAFFVKNKSSLAANPVAPPRILSFQGRLTDASDNPITAATNLRFAIYNDSSATGSALLWQEVDYLVAPDTNGIFSVILGNNTTITQSLFAQNATLYLGITVGNTAELTPRQQLATVPYATNAEVLQGLPPITDAGVTTNTNTVLALNSSGVLSIPGTANTTFQSTGGQFTLTGKILTLNTAAASNSNIQLAPDGMGLIDIQKPVTNTSLNNNIRSAGGASTAAGAVEIDKMFAVLATSSGQSAVTIDQDGAGPVISASHSGTAVFTVDNSGNITAAGNVTGTTIYAGNGTTYFINNTTSNLNSLTLNGTLAVNQGGASATKTNIDSSGNILPGTNNGANLGSPTLNWNNLYVNNLVTTSSSGSNGFWQLNSKVLAPSNTSYDLSIGGSATGSAFQVFGGSNGTIPAGTASTSGYLSFSGAGTAHKVNLLDNGTLGFYNSVGGNAGDGTNPALFITNSGNVGIGTSIAATTLDIRDNTGTLQQINQTAASTNNTVTWDQLVKSSSSTRISFEIQSSLNTTNDSTRNSLVLLKDQNNGSFQTALAFNGPNAAIGAQNTSPLAALDVRTNQYTTPVASISGATGMATLVLDQSSGNGDIFTASSSGQNRFVITQNGNVGIGTTNPSSGLLQVAGNIVSDSAGNNNIGIQSDRWNNVYSQNFNANGGFITNGNNNPLSNVGLYIEKDAKGNAVSVFNQQGLGPILTASASGVSKFTIGNNGSITDANYTTGGGVFFADSTGLFTQTSAGSSSQCLIGGTTPTWATCASGSNGTNYWTSSNGAIYPINSTMDLLIGGTATNSATFAKFAVTGLADSSATNNPTASISATSGNNSGNGIKFDSTGTIQSLTNNNLTLGGNTTGNITISPLNGASGSKLTLNALTESNAATTINLTGSSPILDLTSATTLSLNTTSNRPITTGTGLTTLGGALTVNGVTQTVGNGSAYTIQTTSNSNLYLMPNGTGDLGVNTTSPLALLDARANVYTTNVASISGATGKATLQIDQSGVGDLLSASQSGATRFVIGNDGTLTSSKYNVDKGILYINGTSGVLTESAQGAAHTLLHGNGSSAPSFSAVDLNSTDVTNALGVTNGGLGANLSGSAAIGDLLYASSTTAFARLADVATGSCLISGGVGSAPSWGSCSAAASTNFWQINSKVLAPYNTTLDLAVGGTSTTSAAFQVLALANGSIPAGTASTSGQLSFGSSSQINLLNNATLGFYPSVSGDAGLASASNPLLFLNSKGNILNPGIPNDGYVGIGTNNPIATLDVRASNYANNTASISGATGVATLQIDQSGIGDLISASNSGASKFVVTRLGNVGINQAIPTARLDIADNISATLLLEGTANSSDSQLHFLSINGSGAAKKSGIQEDSSGRFNFYTGAYASGTPFMSAAQSGNISIGALINSTQANQLATLDIRANTYTVPVASVSGATGMATLQIDQSGVGDLLSASQSGATRFVIGNDGTLTSSKYNVDKGILYINGTSGVLTESAQGAAHTLLHGNGSSAPSFSAVDLTADVTGTLPTGSGGTGLASYTAGDLVYYSSGTSLSKLAIGSNNNCLLSTGTAPTWGSCGLGTNYWTVSSGALQPINTTLDLLLGGTATNSATFAKFAVTGLADSSATNNPTASISATSGNNSGNGIKFDSTGTIQSLTNNNLTLGGNTTGNITISPLNGASGSKLTLNALTESNAATTINLTGTNPVISATATNSTLQLNANGSGTLTLNSGGTGNIQFFSSSNTLTSGGNLTLAGTVSLPNSNSLTGVSNFVQFNNGISVGGGTTNKIDSSGNETMNTSTLTSTGNALTLSGNGANIAFTGTSGTNQITTASNQNINIMPNGTGKVGINTTSPLALLDVRANQYTTPVASISGATGMANLLVDQTGVGDLFTASNAGATKFRITNDGSAIFQGNIVEAVGNGASGNGSNAISNVTGDEGSMVPNAGFESNILGGFADGWVAASTNSATITNDTSSPQQGNSSVNITMTNTSTAIYSACFPISGAQGNYNLNYYVKGATPFAQVAGFLDTYTSKANCQSDTSAAVTAAAQVWTATAAWKKTGSNTTALNNSTGTWGRVHFFITCTSGCTNSSTNIDGVRLSQSTVGQGLDYAENYPADPTNIPSLGDIISLTSSGRIAEVKPANKYMDENMIGIVSTNPGEVLDDGSVPNPKVPVALSGRVPVKVSSKNGAIHIGDYLTSSDIPGVAVKATKKGPAVGKALEDYTESDPNKIGSIIVFINLTSYDPISSITNLQQATITQNLGIDQNIGDKVDAIGTKYILKDSNGNIIDTLGAFAQLAAAEIRTGFIDAQNITTNSFAVATDNITIGGQNIKDYILSVVKNSQLAFNNSQIISPLAEIDTIHTHIISPLGENGSIAIKVDDDKISIAKDSSSSAVAVIDNSGNASFSGTLKSNNLAVNSDATVSGTLHAGKIVADEIVGLDAKVGTLAAQNITNITNIIYATPSSSPQNLTASNSLISPSSSSSGLPANYENYENLASYSAYLSYVPHLQADTAEFEQGLISFGPSSLSDTSITGQLSIGGELILADNSINVLGADLELQPLKQGGIAFSGGAIRIDTNGNLTVNGKAVFNGTLAAKIISPIAGQDLTVQLGNSQDQSLSEASPDISKFVVKNASGSAVFALNQLGDIISSGEATINKLNLNIASPALAVSENEIIATSSAGTATINANQREITIDTPLVTENSLIYITPVGQTNEQPVLLRQVPGQSFTVGISQPVDAETKFNWLIIN